MDWNICLIRGMSLRLFSTEDPMATDSSLDAFIASNPDSPGVETGVSRQDDPVRSQTAADPGHPGGYLGLHQQVETPISHPGR